VRTMGLALPEVEEGTAYGSPALNVRGKMFACLAIHRSAEPNTWWFASISISATS